MINIARPLQKCRLRLNAAANNRLFLSSLNTALQFYSASRYKEVANTINQTMNSLFSESKGGGKL